MKHFYYMVPKCPECGSQRTGRYVKRPFTQRDCDYMMEESLKNGEIIRFKKQEPVQNAFCMQCGHTWAQRINVVRLTSDEIEDEIMKRKTDYLLNEYLEKNPVQEKQKSLFGGFFSGLTRF